MSRTRTFLLLVLMVSPWLLRAAHAESVIETPYTRWTGEAGLSIDVRSAWQKQTCPELLANPRSTFEARNKKLSPKKGDAEAHLVLADDLLERGNGYGEVISLVQGIKGSRQREPRRTEYLRERLEALIQTHPERLLPARFYQSVDNLYLSADGVIEGLGFQSVEQLERFLKNGGGLFYKQNKLNRVRIADDFSQNAALVERLRTAMESLFRQAGAHIDRLEIAHETLPNALRMLVQSISGVLVIYRF